METEAMVAMEHDLIEWGLVERSAKGLAWTRRFRGAVMREAARYAERERTGERPEGPPMQTAVRAALGGLDLPAAAELTPLHERFLVAVELAALPDAVRELLD